jgi:hypothetical protein
MVAAALDAAEALAADGVQARVLDMHTVKPIDRDALLAAARETGALVVAEEHLAHGGLGSVVAMTLAEANPVPIRFVNLGDQFGESGSPEELIRKFGMTADKVIEAARSRSRRQARLRIAPSARASLRAGLPRYGAVPICARARVTCPRCGAPPRPRVPSAPGFARPAERLLRCDEPGPGGVSSVDRPACHPRSPENS